MNVPSIPALLVEHWVLCWPLTGDCIALAALYLLAARHARRWPIARTLAFLAGLIAVQVALESGINSYDDELLSVHMVQHLLLLELAPALLLYARPLHLALRVLPAAERRTLGRALVAGRRHATPFVCLTVFTAVTLGTHIPAFFDATVHHQTLHDAEHIAYLVAGLVMWWPLLGDPAPRQRLGAIGQLAYATAAMLPMTVIGAYLNRDQTLFYPAYALPARTLGVSAVIDQQQAGAIMWVLGTVVMAVIVLGVALGSMLAAERRQRARDLHEALG